MIISRRNLILSGASAFVLSACATNLNKYSHTPIAELAASEEVCYSTYVTLRAGVAESPVAVHGCGPSLPMGPDGILQAASLTKPVIAFLALELARAGMLDLQSPVLQIPAGRLPAPPESIFHAKRRPQRLGCACDIRTHPGGNSAQP